MIKFIETIRLIYLVLSNRRQFIEFLIEQEIKKQEAADRQVWIEAAKAAKLRDRTSKYAY